MAISTVSINSPGDVSDPMFRNDYSFPVRASKLGQLIQKLISGGSGTKATFRYGTKRAFGTVVYSTSSGTPGVTINGVAVAVADGGSDLINAGLLVAAINASTNALVQDLVHASCYSAIITLVSALPGDWVEIMGVRFLAKGGTTAVCTPSEFTTGGSDTADAATLVVAINNHPVLSELVKASSSAGVVTVRAYRALPPSLAISSSHATRVALTDYTATATAVLTPSTTVCISALWKGTLGNCITIAAIATGTTASGARLTGGLNGTNQTL